jgi:hypothetical protein
LIEQQVILSDFLGTKDEIYIGGRWELTDHETKEV